MTLLLSGTDGLSDVDGSASTPAIRGTDTNTGIFFPAADTIAFSEGGVEAMRIDSSGNLGIGTSSPDGKLTVFGNGSFVSVNGGTSGGSLSFNSTTTGTTNTITSLNNNGNAFSNIDYKALNHIFKFGNTEAMRIDSNSNLLVGTTSSTGRITATVSSTQDIFAGNDGSSAQFAVTYNGVIFARNTTIQSLSDERLKENIVDSNYGLDVINALRPVCYDWKQGYGNPNQLGFIAQEVEKIFPRMIGEWKIRQDEDSYKTIGTGELIPVLVKAIQEQQAIITDLKSRIETLEAK